MKRKHQSSYRIEDGEMEGHYKSGLEKWEDQGGMGSGKVSTRPANPHREMAAKGEKG